MIVRAERAGDQHAIYAVIEAAFEHCAEADLVDTLRSDAQPFISMVAERDGEIVGHICFSPVTIEAAAMPGGCVGLAPMAVAPTFQNRGVGSELVRSGLRECGRLGQEVVVVLGHPAYYPRFGFVPASRYGLRCEYSVPDDTFMALEITPGALRKRSGLVRYHAAFADL